MAFPANFKKGKKKGKGKLAKKAEGKSTGGKSMPPWLQKGKDKKSKDCA